MTRMLLTATAVMVIVWSAAGQDSNFGLKVKCFVKDGTVLCPGCNSRAGLSCPRNLKKENCNIKPEPTYPPVEITPTEIYENGIGTTKTATKEYDTEPSNTSTESSIKPETPFTVQQEEIDWIKLAKDEEFRLFIYYILKPHVSRRRRMREAPMEEEIEDDTCEFNGDCPCPLICCKTGDGCPKRCMSGIRLPPPWG